MEIGDEIVIKWSIPGWMRDEGKYSTMQGVVKRISSEIILIYALAPKYLKGRRVQVHRSNCEDIAIIKEDGCARQTGKMRRV